MLAHNRRTRFLSGALFVLGAWLLAAGCQGKVEGQPCGGPCGMGQVCQAGQCVCSAGLMSCGGMCVTSNAMHCGSCTTMCSGTDACSSSGMCVGDCDPGQTKCSDGACIVPG